MEPDLKELLRRKADDMRLPPDLPPTTLRRARRRRGWSAAFAGVTAIAMVAGTITGVQLLTRSSPTAPTTTNPPTPVPSNAGPAPSGGGTESPPAGDPEAISSALWPAASAAGLDFLRQQIAEGNAEYAVRPDDSAVEFAVRVLGWPRDRVGVQGVSTTDTADGQVALVGIWNEDLGPFDPTIQTVVSLRAAPGVGGGLAWLVTRVTSGAFDLRCPPPGPAALDTSGPVHVCGSLNGAVAAGTATATVEYAESELQPSEAASTADLTIAGDRLEGDIPLIATYPDSDVSFAVRVFAGDGTLLGMDARRMATRNGDDLGGQPALTREAADTREAIREAARSSSYEALRRLIEAPFTFSYGHSSNGPDVDQRAVAFWKEAGFEPLRIMSALLDMPYTTVPDDGGLIYVWPGIADWSPGQLRQIDELAPEWRSALRQIYPDFDRQLRGWIESGGYIGWRIGIREDGHWLYFVAGD